MVNQVCINCGKKYAANAIVYACTRCGDLLDIQYDYDVLKAKLEGSRWKQVPLSVWKYRDFMPIQDTSRTISLNEGGTGLHFCQRVIKQFPHRNLYVKNEGENPTGSFKDRGMTVGITKAAELNMKTVICASTGNTSASLAAYAARAGIQCIVFIPSGKIAYGKLAQAMAYGAKVIQIHGNFDQALKTVRELSRKHEDVYLLNSINPYRLEGQKTLAFEICDQLNMKAPDKVIMPVGNAGNISAAWKGFLEFHKLGLIETLPEMIGIQAEGAAPIVHAVKKKMKKIEPIDQPETIATAIRIGNPVSWKKALQAISESRGTAEVVTDQEIMEAQKMLARHEGLFVEPASASSIAGLKKLYEAGTIDKADKVVCVTTGHGLKDPDAAMKISEKPYEVDAEVDVIEQLLQLPRRKILLAHAAG